MAFWVYPTGHDMQNRLNNDSLGQLYLSLASAWTFFLLCGMAFLIRNRKLPFLCMRKLPLGILAVTSLHIYWVLCMLAYILNGYFACSMEYWIMSTYLPFGIALYQASNTQLLHVAGLQKQFTSAELNCLQKHSVTKLRGWRRLFAKWHRFNPTRRTLLGICMGMIAQVVPRSIRYPTSTDLSTARSSAQSSSTCSQEDFTRHGVWLGTASTLCNAERVGSGKRMIELQPEQH